MKRLTATTLDTGAKAPTVPKCLQPGDRCLRGLFGIPGPGRLLLGHTGKIDCKSQPHDELNEKMEGEAQCWDRMLQMSASPSQQILAGSCMGP